LALQLGFSRFAAASQRSLTPLIVAGAILAATAALYLKSMRGAIVGSP
jgi:hypothetical protein